MSKRNRPSSKLSAIASDQHRAPSDSINDESDYESDHSEHTPSPPSTPRKKQTLVAVTPTPIRNITRELALAQVASPHRNGQSSFYLRATPRTLANGNKLCQQAKALFRRTAIPSRLVGRGNERSTMMDFWNAHVLGNKPGCLYVSGSPGTGKTAMLTEIIRITEDEVGELRTHQVNVVMVNCMSVGDPKAIYTKIVTELKGSGSKPNPDMDAVQEAEMLLNGKSEVLNVVVLDEIDHLITKDQDVLYKVFEWASIPSSRLVLIGIANALDLTDRILPRLRAKNCEPQLLNFNPYSVSEITSIIKDRLYSLVENEDDPFGAAPTPNENTPLPLIQSAAVELCARKVAASMGDLRTALDVCRQAIEMAENEWKKKTAALIASNPDAPPIVAKVTIGHVMKVLQIVYGSPNVQKLKQLNLQQKVVIGVLMVMNRSTSGSTKSQITMTKFREQYGVFCSKSGSSISPVSRTELNDLISMIETTGMITLTNHKDERLRRIQLCVTEDDIMQMIRSVNVLDTWIADILEQDP